MIMMMMMVFDWTTFILEINPRKYTGHCATALWKARWLQTIEISLHNSDIVEMSAKSKTKWQKQNQIKSNQTV